MHNTPTNFRLKVLEAELKTVRVVGLTTNLDLARAASERERELRKEINRLKTASAPADNGPQDPQP